MSEKPRRDHPNAARSTIDLGRAQKSIVTIQSSIPEDAFTAETLGEQRTGSGVVIRESGLVLTIGYLITEAESVWIARADGRVIPGHALAIDQETGFGLVQALAPLDCPALEIGRSDLARIGDPVVVAAGGGHEGRQRFDRGEAGVRRLLGILSRGGDFHRAGASVLGRRRRDRRRRTASRRRLAPCRADARAQRTARRQHDCAYRTVDAHSR